MKLSIWVHKSEREDIEIELPVYAHVSLGVDYDIYTRLDHEGTVTSLRKDNVSVLISRIGIDLNEPIDASLFPDPVTGERECSEEEFTEVLSLVENWVRATWDEIAATPQVAASSSARWKN